MIKLLKDILLMVVLITAMTKIGKTQELQSDDGGVELDNGCYSLILTLDQPDGSKMIKTIIDCRGGRPI